MTETGPLDIKMMGVLPGHERSDGSSQTGYRVYDPSGICPTLLAHSGGYGIMVLEEKDA